MLRMVKTAAICLTALSVLAGAALANAPERAVRPMARPTAAPPRIVDTEGLMHRLSREVEAVQARPMLRPHVRPQSVRASTASANAGGGLCGNSALRGRSIGSISGRGGCGISNAVEVTHVHGIALSQTLTVSCEAANAFANWTGRTAIPAVGSLGGGIQRFEVGGYACRPRNNQRGNQISEHGRGNAVDVMGFRLKDGASVSVLNGWNSNRWGRILREMHRSACGTFGTVLGPESNRFHRDHFHFDTARQRNGPYCR